MGISNPFEKIPSWSVIMGSYGEWLAKNFLKSIPGALILHDVLIDGADGHTSQIDLILVGNKGIYVIELKMFVDAKIYGNIQASDWYYYNHGKKYEMYSPVKQNQRHVEYLKNFVKEFGEIPVFSIITMVCEGFKIYGRNPENTVICNSLPAMKRALYQLAETSPVVFDDAKKEAVFEHIRQNQYKGKEARIQHKQSAIEYKQSLTERKEQKLCPYCNCDLILRTGKNGEFYGCKNFPKCRYTRNK